MQVSRFLFKYTVIAVAASLGGCAVSPYQVAEQAEKRTTEIANIQQQATKQTKRVEPLTRLTGNYVGGQPLPVSHSLSLPASARDVTFNFGGAYGTLDQVARNIRSTTGITVRINPDVMDLRMLNAAAAPAPAPAATAPVPVPLPGSPVRMPPVIAPQTGEPPISQVAVRAGNLPLSFSGDLGDYLNQIAGVMAISWEYANGEIHFFRRVTRTFTLMVGPGNIKYSDDINSSGQGSNGSTAQQSQAGSFSSTSGASTKAEYDPWASIESALKTMISGDGRFTVNQSSGSIIVTDTKEVVDRIAGWVKSENSALTRQVAIEVREIALEVRDSSQIGVDLNVVYQRLNVASGAADWVFRFGAPTSVTDAGAGSIGFNVARPDARLSGTNVAIQALNSLGNVVFDSSRTLLTTNRVPGRLQAVTDRAYLAETTPASGGLTGSGGVPGLKPGLVTYGDNLIVVPTIGENSAVLLQLYSTRSNLIELRSESTGSGQTFQQINTPVLDRKKNAQNFQVNDGETLVIVGNNAETWTSKDNHSITGGSRTASQSRTVNVLLVTPRIMAGL